MPRYRLVLAAVTLAFALVSPSEARAKDAIHVVHKGQSLGRIARRYNAPVAVVREVNNLKPGEPLQPGQRLLIPDKSKHEYWLKRARARADAEATAAKAAKEAEKPAKKQASTSKGAKAKEAHDDDASATGQDEGGEKGVTNKRDARKGSKSKNEDGAGPKGDYSAKPKKKGYVRMVRGSERFEGQLTTKTGKLAPGALTGLSKILRHYPSGAKTTIDSRLAALIGLVSDHFGGRTIRVVSGFRPYSPAQYTPHSNHNHGRAIDFSVDGVPNTVVRDYCRKFRNAGVGYYPNSSFVHLDVRSTKVYWVDYSGPGEKPRYTNTPAPAGDPVPPEEAHAHEDAGSIQTPSPDSQPSDSTAPSLDSPEARQ